MSDSDAFWLKLWEWLATSGFLLVILGVIMEGVGHFKKFAKERNRLKLEIEKWGWLILVGGLAMEFLGEHKAKRIADRENARLTLEAADARKTAAELLARIQPRRIKPEQHTQIVNRLRNKDKGPVRITFTKSDAEAAVYALNIRNVLFASAFNTNQVKLDFAESPDWNFPLQMGLEFSMRDGSDNLPFAQETGLAFRGAGVNLKSVVKNEESLPGVLQISVWPKPFE